MPDKKQKIPEGQIFSRAYLQVTTPLKDSERFRVRLAIHFRENLQNLVEDDLAYAIAHELGTVVLPMGGYATSGPSWDFGDFFESAKLRDLLDCITLAATTLRAHAQHDLREKWLKFVSRAFLEEGLGYKLDSEGGVRFVVDEEFERNRQATISALGAPRYTAVAHLIESSFSRLDVEPFDTKTCWREVFEAVETLAKIVAGTRADLDSGFIQKTLKPLAQSRYQQNDAAAQAAVATLVDGLGNWVNAGHKYRHGHNTQEPISPPLEVAVLFVSQGAGYIRWLVDLDQKGSG